MKVILNIGLDNVPVDENYANSKLNSLIARRAFTAAQAVRAHGFKVITGRVVRSDTEPTLVVQATDDAPGQDNRIDMLSTALHRDCIAVWYPDEGFGALIGPRADAWGEFNPEFFIMPDGSRLASTHQPLETP